MRVGRKLLPALLPLVGCRALVDPAVSFRDCPASDRDELEGGTLEQLQERCWQVDDADDDPSDVFVFDGDLVIRVNEPSAGHREQWVGDDEGPMVYQSIDSDFLVVARVEAVHKITGDHCLAEGNRAGLVARRSSPSVQWATIMLGPFRLDEFDCGDESEMPPPTLVAVSSRDEALGPSFTAVGSDNLGVGDDGEVDLALCRVDGLMAYYYRDARSALRNPAGSRPRRTRSGKAPSTWA